MTDRHKPGTFARAKRRSTTTVTLSRPGWHQKADCVPLCNRSVLFYRYLVDRREDSERTGSRRESNRGVGERAGQSVTVSMERPKKATRASRLMACAGLGSCQSPRASASTIPNRAPGRSQPWDLLRPGGPTSEDIVSTTLYNGQFPGPSPALQGRQARHGRYP